MLSKALKGPSETGMGSIAEEDAMPTPVEGSAAAEPRDDEAEDIPLDRSSGENAALRADDSAPSLAAPTASEVQKEKVTTMQRSRLM